MTQTIYEKNIALFKRRFPGIKVVERMGVYELLTARNGSPTARDSGALLHSMYNPEREAEKMAGGRGGVSAGEVSAIFLGFGLGYGPIAWAKEHIKDAHSNGKGGALILIESDSARFFAVLRVLDWSAVFAVEHLVIALGCPAEKVIPLITSQADIRTCCVFAVPSQTAHNAPYFDAVSALIERNKRKEEINEATTRKFAYRWKTNVERNVRAITMGLLPKLVTDYSDGFLPPPSFAAIRANSSPTVTILAAGPSLETVLTRLPEIKQHSAIIAVDTALRAALRAGVEPAYIVLTDPQYYAWRHIAGLKSPSSVLVTDLSAYPAVLRFECRAVALAHSAIPQAQKAEHSLALTLPDLGAGGSVASCAWNLAYLLGAKRIYVAGLDLSFPRGLTHIRGSTAEETAHAISNRLCTAETAAVPRMISGGSETGLDYNGNMVATDSRMKMFAWWFESRLAEIATDGRDVKTYTLCPAGLRIPGIEVGTIDDILGTAALLH